MGFFYILGLHFLYILGLFSHIFWAYFALQTTHQKCETKIKTYYNQTQNILQTKTKTYYTESLEVCNQNQNQNQKVQNIL
jgi:hypothetical protein